MTEERDQGSGISGQETSGQRRTSEMTASSAQICRDLGWKVGDKISYLDERGRRTVGRITAIGRVNILLDLVRSSDHPVSDDVEDLPWQLNHRDWERTDVY